MSQNGRFPAITRRRAPAPHGIGKFLSVFAASAWLAMSVSAATFTWDADPGTPGAQDGAGNWTTSNDNWWDGASNVLWTNAAGDSAIFGSDGTPGAVAVAAGIVVENLTINTNYSFTSNPLTLTNRAMISVPGSGTIATIGSILNGTAFTKEGAGTLVLNPSGNNTFSGLTTINEGVVQVGGNDSRIYINGDLLINAGGTYRYSNGGSTPPSGGIPPTATVIINGGVVTNSATSKYFFASKVVLDRGGIIAGTGSDPYCVTNTDARDGAILLPIHRIVNSALAKSTAGTVRIGSRPNSSGSDGYLVTMNAGTLLFDYAYTGNNAVRLKANGPLTLGGGLMIFSNSVTTISPNANNPGTGGTTVNPGASAIFSYNLGTGGGNLTMGAITRNVGGTLNLWRPVGPGLLGSSSPNVNGIVGGWATYNSTDFATGTSSWTNDVAYVTTTDPAGWTALDNVSLSEAPSANVDDVTINSLRLSAASTIAINAGKTLNIASGGLLTTGSGDSEISGGNLQGGASGGDLIVHQYSTGDLTISADLTDNNGSSLTKSGDGKLILTGVNHFTGANYFNGGNVEVSDVAKLANGGLVMNGGALRYTGGDASSSRAITVIGLGATLDISDAETTFTQTEAINGSGAALGDLGGLTKIGAGKLVLTASNYFNGVTEIQSGALLVNGTLAYDHATWNAGQVSVNGGTLGGAGTIQGEVTVQSGGTLAPGATIGTLALESDLSLNDGSVAAFDLADLPASGDQVTVAGNLIVSNSTVSISVAGGALQPGSYPLIQYSGKLTGSFNPVVAIAAGEINGSVSIDTTTPGQVNLQVVPEVAITTEPDDAIVSIGETATLNVVASGSAPIFYRWYTHGGNPNNPPSLIADATASSFSILNAQSLDSGYYSVVVSNSYNSVTSRVASVIVGDVAPIISGPEDQTVIAGNDATFNVSVEIANPQPSLQWQTNGVDVDGATGTSFTLENVPFALNGTTVSVIASNVVLSVTNSALLTVIVPPTIDPEPAGIMVNAGDTATFTAGVSGFPTPDLQWFKNNTALPGEVGSTLSIADAQGGNIGNYTLVASNIAGVVTSSVARLIVNSTTLNAVTLAPANGATGVCYDTPLYLTFNAPVTALRAGVVRIYNATNSDTPVDVIDLSLSLATGALPRTPFSGDNQAFNYYPVVATGSTAAIYPHAGVLTSNQTYFVTLEGGVVADGSGAYFVGVTDTNAWRFTTKPTGPADPDNLIVAADGSGDFVTVQGAVDSIAANNTTPRVINIRNGTYVEIVNISGKHNVTFRGESRLGTVIRYSNNANLAPGGTTHARMTFKVNANDIAIENLTINNSTPQGGSQAEALMIESGARRCIVNGCELVSRQDTILANINSSQAYFYNSKITGNFDYIWGGGNLFFENCVIHTIAGASSYNLTAARTDTATSLSASTPWVNPNGATYSANGFSFVRCTLEADPGVVNISLAGNNGTAGGLSSWAFCKIDTDAYVTPTTTLSNNYVFWQFGNTDLSGVNPVSFANAQTIGITNDDPRLLTVTNVTAWFYGWTPEIANENTAPTFTSPDNDSVLIVNPGANVSITNTAVDVDLPAQILTFSLLSGPDGATLNDGVFAWRPTLAQADSTNVIEVTVTDDGLPNLSATNRFSVIVNPLTLPNLSVASADGIQFALTIDGQTGPDYAIQVSTNLAEGIWETLLITNSPALPFTFTDLNGSAPAQFYRVLVGPPLP